MSLRGAGHPCRAASWHGEAHPILLRRQVLEGDHPRTPSRPAKPPEAQSRTVAFSSPYPDFLPSPASLFARPIFIALFERLIRQHFQPVCHGPPDDPVTVVSNHQVAINEYRGEKRHV